MKKIKNTFHLSHTYYELKIDFTKPLGELRYKGSLGNLTTAGWFWDFQDYELLTALGHISRSSIKDDFIKDWFEAELDNPIYFDKIINDLLENDFDYFIKLFTGWRHPYSNIYELIDSFISNLELEDEEEKENLSTKLYDKAEEIHKQVVENLTDEIKEKIEQCENIEELLDTLNLEEYVLNEAYEIIGNIWN